MGSVWSRLGSEVTVVEFLPRIALGFDLEVANALQKTLTAQGMIFHLGTKVSEVKVENGRATATATKGEEKLTFDADKVLVSVGRRAFAEGVGADKIGVELDDKKRIKVDAHFRTNVEGIYAIGDVIAGPMLAHKAEEEGIACVEMIAGKAGHVNYDVIPNVVYTFPEIASVGKTEEELKEAGVAYNTGKFPFTANGRAKANHQTDGFVKVLADAKTDRVLGVHIVSSDAGNMIAEAAVAMEFGAAAEDIARTCHAHPTLPEAVKGAALAVAKRAIHM
jgi:dihydrolipoamide dehydrogenase